MRTDDFDYDLPDAAIAQEPIEPRDAARLLRVTDMTDHLVADLPDLLVPGDVVVVNNTKVRRARLAATRVPSGGAVEVLLLGVDTTGVWEALVRPARRLRPGDILDVGDVIRFVLDSEPDRGKVRLRVDSVAGASPGDVSAVEQAVADLGSAPLPPYISTALQHPERYQTVFADVVGSAAAPTAGLHFTDALLGSLATREIEVVEVELRVGLDTFRPITAVEVADHEIHREWCEVTPDAAAAINARRSDGGRVVAVGTTVLRTLESHAADGAVRPGAGETDLYITPGYRFDVVDVLMTNFHVPRSSLLVLVAAFAGPDWLEAYETALSRDYRFLSFGDAMLLDRA